jgi:uncharacterized protein
MSKKRKFPRTNILLIVIIISILASIAVYKNTPTDSPSTKQEICIKQFCFEIEIASTASERQLWLMYREYLGEWSGMLFVFPEPGIYPFWMKNTLIPLDMIWINSNNEIIDIQEAAPCTKDPCPSYPPKGTASYVLEINQGISKKYWIKIGDIIEKRR